MFSSIYNRVAASLTVDRQRMARQGERPSTGFRFRLRFWQISLAWTHSNVLDASGRRADRASFLTIRIGLIPAS